MAHRSPFYEMHVKASAVMQDIDGWSMPWHYGDWQAEYQACRETLGVYDMSHFGRIRVKGNNAQAWFAQYGGGLSAGLSEGRQDFVHLDTTDFKGRILLQHQDKGYLVVTEPSERESLLCVLEKTGDLNVCDETFKTAMVGFRGPRALALLVEKLPFDLPEMTPDTVICTTYFFMRFVISIHDAEVRLILPAPMAGMAWDMLQKYGQTYNAKLTGWQALNQIISQE